MTESLVAGSSYGEVGRVGSVERAAYPGGGGEVAVLTVAF